MKSKMMDTYVNVDEFISQNEYIKRVKANNITEYRNGKTAYIETFGCQQNVADSEKIEGILEEMGYKITKDVEKSDFIIYNTCAIRENAEDRVFGKIGSLKKLKLITPNLIIAICGCMTQQKHIVEKIKMSYPQIDIIMGTHSLHLLPKLLYEATISDNKVVDVEERKGIFSEGLPIKRMNQKTARVTVMYGCDNFCTYCIVPYVRGREYSRRSDNIISEVKNLVDNGYQEITLLGQNVNSYGKGLDEKINFSYLLRLIDKIPGNFIIKFMTSHPKDCSKELIDTIAECSKISKHIHLPVQSGSNRILKLMNRKYSIEDYKQLVYYAKEKISNLVLSTDIIVGFPGEIYDDFLLTKKLIEEIKYDFLYSFIYSKRVGTVAAKMKDIISDKDKHKWFNELLEAQERIKLNKNIKC